MAVIEMNKNPSRRELLVFGLVMLAFAGVVGAIFHWRLHAPDTARGIWITGGALTVIHYAIPPLRRLLYLGWMYATFPIGFVLSHVILGIVYYGVFTPIGVIMRLVGYDPLTLRSRPGSKSYWVEHDPHQNVERYFRQS